MPRLVATDRKLAIPAELVFVPYERDGAQPFFGWTTNGLASGNSLDEATIHGLLEVMERDALSMNKARDRSESVDPGDLPSHFAALAAQWQELGVRLAVRYVPNEFGLPCFEASLYEPGDMPMNLAGGSGMHVCRDIALTRAICEAAQSRLSHIHGGRDDITKFYSKFVKLDSSVLGQIEERVVKDMFDTVRRAKYCDVPNYHYDDGSARSILRDLLERLSQCGFQTVLRYEFAVELGCLHVVKVIVPKCELYEPQRPRIGPRLLSRVIGNA